MKIIEKLTAKSLVESIKLLWYLCSRNSLFICCFSSALGDTLLITGLISKLKKKYPSKKIVVELHKRSPHLKALFFNNPDLSFVTCKHHCSTKRHLRPEYVVLDETEKSLYEQLAESIGLKDNAFPKLFFSEQELNSEKYERLNSYVAICPEGKQSFVANRKEWGISNFQEVIKLFPQIKFVQIGTPSVRLLNGVIDARGKEIRELSLIMKNADFFIGLEGGLMHLAKAVGTKSIIIYGGVIDPKISGYSENINIYNKVDCSPCFNSLFSRGKCETMKCMKGISVNIVVKEIKEMLVKCN